jgi:Ras-related protein Rab-7A
MFDVNKIDTLDALKKWWAEYCVGAPLVEEDLLEHPCFVVGNKIDLTENEERISTAQVREFLTELIPSQELPTTTSGTPLNSSPIQVQKPPSVDIKPRASSSPDNKRHPPGTPRSLLKSANKFDSLSSMNTTTSIYHTPSSSLFTDTFHTARSSPDTSTPILAASASTPVLRSAPALRQHRFRTVSTGSASSGSAATITPSLFAREQQENTNGNNSNETTLTTPEEDILDLPDSDSSPGSLRFSGPPPLPERGPSLHFTSAKTGEGVKELFEHVAARVVQKMEYEEYFETRQMHYREASGAETIRLGTDNGSRIQIKAFGKMRIGCCA